MKDDNTTDTTEDLFLGKIMRADEAVVYDLIDNMYDEVNRLAFLHGEHKDVSRLREMAHMGEAIYKKRFGVVFAPF